MVLNGLDQTKLTNWWHFYGFPWFIDILSQFNFYKSDVNWEFWLDDDDTFHDDTRYQVHEVPDVHEVH